MRFGQSAILTALLAVEIAVFAQLGPKFFTAENAAEAARLGVELGLLAVALTPVIVSGGIDLSVGSLLGLCAVLFGKLWRDGLDWTGPWPVPVAALAAVAVGGLAGALNGALITRFRIPPLIVTLGTFSLFRGLAEGLTHGVDNFTHFPDGFLQLGQGYFAGVPVQLPILIVVAAGYWAFLRRTIWGRALFAIGFAPDGARHAGIPVGRRVFVVYLLAGLVSGVAAVVYASRAGQAKADAGTGYELAAITAVVLGGTSIFGGRGSVLGTLLGLAVIVVLRNGFLMAGLPAEPAGVLTGAVLLAAIVLDRLRAEPAKTPSPISDSGFTMKNGQLAVLCVVILAAAGILAATNWYLVKSLPTATGNGPGPAPTAGRKTTIAMMPKSKGNPYFIACRKGAEEAAAELGVDLTWDGPTDPDPAKQNEIVDAWITRGVDAIAVAVENREGISSALRRAKSKGIKVITWDADAEDDARDFFVNQATPQGIGEALMDNAARVLGGKGEFAIISASLTASNMIAWQKEIEKRRAAKYPDIKMAVLRPCDDLKDKAFDEATAIMNAYPNVKLIMAICSPAVPGAAEAVKQSGRKDVHVVGLSLPKMNRDSVHAGITDTVILWNTMDLGYLAVYAAKQRVDGSLEPGAKTMRAGRLKEIQIAGDNILLGQPFAFRKDNIDGFDF